MIDNILNRFYRFFYPYGSRRRVLIGPLIGTKYICKPSMGLSYALGFEIKRMSFLKRYINEGDMVLDVGANCGQISLYLSKLVGSMGKVFSFEPTEYAFNILCENKLLNKINNIKPINAAVSDSEKEVQMVLNTELTTGGILKSNIENNDLDKDVVNIRSVALDKYCYETNIIPKFIKIDVEGHGDKVLSGAYKIINEYKPFIYIEMHMPQEQQAVKEILQDIGYKVETPEGKIITDPQDEWHDCLWCYYSN